MSGTSLITGEKTVPVLYLDIDGTVRKGYDELGRWVNGAADVEIYPEAVVRIREWKDKGGRVVGVSNQGGIALGHLTMKDCAAAMLETQSQCGGLFDKLAWCSHHPDAEDPEMAVCWCRKPKPGLIIEAALGLAHRFPGEMYPPHLGLMVGDRAEDKECAKLAGLTFMDAGQWRRGIPTPPPPGPATPPKPPTHRPVG